MLFVTLLVLLVASYSLVKWRIEEKQEQARKAKLAKYRIRQQKELGTNTAEIFRVKNVIFINPRKMRFKTTNSLDNKLPYYNKNS